MQRTETLTRIGQAIANNWPVNPADAAWMHSEITRLDAEKEAEDAQASEPEGADDKPGRRKKTTG